MFCMRTSRAVSTVLKPMMLGKAVHKSTIVSARTFTTITLLRPTTLPTTFSAFRTTSLISPTTTSAGVTLDILPKISESPMLANMQVRCGPRDTYDPSHFVRKRRHGFLSRIRTRKGRALLKRRKAKGRKNLSH